MHILKIQSSVTLGKLTRFLKNVSNYLPGPTYNPYFLDILVDMLPTGTERAEHIQIIITYAQEADNVIPDQLRLLVNR